MTGMHENSEEFERGLMLGFARAGKPVDQPLTKLSLLASRRKFARPAVPSLASVTGFKRTETSAFIPDAARKHLIRLVSGKDGNSTDGMARGALTALKRSGFSLHPFDFAKLEDFILRNAEDLGPDARQWLSIVHPEKASQTDLYVDEEVTEENLAQVSRSQRVQFLRRMRQKDPAQARVLIEGLIGGEQAEMRLRYLSIVGANFSEADKPFVETLLSDRAPSVKELANTLLGRLPGSEAYGRRITLLKDYFEVKTEGLLRRRKVLHYKGPGGKKLDERAKFIGQALSGASLGDFAAAMEVDEASLADMALQNSDERALVAMVLQMVIGEGRVDTLSAHRAKFDGQGFDLLPQIVTEQFQSLDSQMQDEILAIVIQPSSWTSFPMSHLIEGLANILDRPLHPALAHQVLDSPAWKKTEDNLRQHYINVWASLIPASLSAKFSEFSEGYSPRATTYHRFLHALMQPN
jgi:hypothetical protein